MASPVTDSFLSGGLAIATRHWPRANPRGTIALVHGYCEHAGRYDHVGRALVERGYDVWAMDLRGHGRSEGPRAYVTDMQEHVGDVDRFVARVRNEAKGGPLFVVAHSMGGCIATLWALTKKPDIAGLVLSAPALKLGSDFSPAKVAAGRFLGKFFPRLPIEKLKSGSMSRDPNVIREYELDALVYRGWARTGFGLAFIHASEEIGRRMEEIELPLLVLQGGDDKVINRDGGIELHQRASSKDKKLVVYDGLYHEIFNEPEKDRVLGDLASWLDAHTDQSATVDGRAQG